MEKERILNEKKEPANYGIYDTKTKFGITAKDLQGLLKSDTEAISRLEEVGGIDKLCQLLKTDKSLGLTENDNLVERRSVFGRNEMTSRQTKSIWRHLFEAISDHMLIILIIAAIISIGLSFYKSPDKEYDDKTGFIEGFGILIAVIIIVLVTAIINRNKESQFQGLQSKLGQQFRCDVVRNGGNTSLCVSEILVGDICLVKYGDAVPADGLVISSNDLRLDESSHTGESDCVSKNATHNPILFSGTHVMEGTGKMLVCAVGENSQRGIIFALLNFDGDDDNSTSLLRTKLNRIAYYITIIGTLISVLTFIILITRFCIERFAMQHRAWNSQYFEDIIGFLIISITLLVVAIPEGLPLAVILSLSYSIKKMMLDNNLVRHLDSCETMGSATIICSDKTGTLTTNMMSVVDCYVADEFGMNEKSLKNLPTELKELLAFSISLNTGYFSYIAIDGYGQIGNKTECALLNFVSFLGCDYAEMRHQHPEDSFRKVFTFNSQRKWMATVAEWRDAGSNPARDRCLLFVKGAPEIVLEKCSWIKLKDVDPILLDEVSRKKIVTEVVEQMAVRGLRTICIAYKDIRLAGDAVHGSIKVRGKDWNWNDENVVVSDLVFLAIVGLEDPVRTEVPGAISECNRAGISVKMITGDNLHTAKFVAQKCGLYIPSSEHMALTGSEFNKLIRREDETGVIDQQLFDEVWPRLRVLARASPQDKYNLVQHLMLSSCGGRRQIVAVTGDGTNDGPALKKAHIGLCMGISGTDVAKEASDIILLDDNFASIVKAVVWGRHVCDSIGKFLQFQLSINFVALVLTLVGACVLADTPIRGIQMLWVNLLIDSLASLSLATEAPSENLLDRSPTDPSASLITPIIAINIASSAAYQVMILLILLFSGESLVSTDPGYSAGLKGLASEHYTFVFNTFVIMILFNEINARKIDASVNVFAGLQHSPIFVVLWIGSFVIQVLIVEFGGDVFCTVKLTFDEWMWCLFFGISQLLLYQIVTTLIRNLYLKKTEEDWDDTIKRQSIYIPHIYSNSVEKMPLFKTK